jgi:hypothetical protein
MKIAIKNNNNNNNKITKETKRKEGKHTKLQGHLDLEKW